MAGGCGADLGFFLNAPKFPAVTGLSSPAALIKTAAEPKTISRTSAPAQHKLHERREDAAAANYFFFYIYIYLSAVGSIDATVPC